MARPGVAPASKSTGTLAEVLAVFLRLGLTSFGGPVAHIGYLREEIVVRRGWVDEATYADMVALSQFLPGPASSQVVIALGSARAGLVGGIVAWLGFALPSALAMTLFGLGLNTFGAYVSPGWLHGLKVVAVAVVAQAVWGMALRLAPDRPRATIALAAAVLLVLWPTGPGQVLVILAGGLAGWRLLGGSVGAEAPTGAAIATPRALAWGSAAALLLCLLGAPLLATITSSQAVAMFAAFFRAGSLIFGGGHVVLPLLERFVVAPGWVSTEQFVAGYGAAQALPGPLLTFAAFLGAMSATPPNGWSGAALALVAIFAPSFLFLWMTLPLWGRLRRKPPVQAALQGINAAVVGLLLAALYHPVITSAIRQPQDVALALAAFGLLQVWKAPSWLVVALTALGGAVLF